MKPVWRSGLEEGLWCLTWSEQGMCVVIRVREWSGGEGQTAGTKTLGWDGEHQRVGGSS